MSFMDMLFTPVAQAVQDAVPHAGEGNWIFGTAPQGAALVLIKGLIIVATMGGICLMLRLLFGPGGPMRPKEFGTSHIAERKERNALLKDLKRRRRAGDITKKEYLQRRWDIYEKR